MPAENIGSPLFWIGFGIFVFFMLALDLGVFHRKAHEIKFKEAVAWTAAWVFLAIAFNAFIYHRFGSEKALEFLTGYVIEEALSVDNLFVFVLIFSYFGVPKVFQHRVLFYGILGALVMRGFFIILGAELLHRFTWVIYAFGALLVLTALKLFFQKEIEVHPEKNYVLRIARRLIPSVGEFRGKSFFVKENGMWLATPLFFVLLTVEVSDLVFAVDSIPAIFGVTTDPFIVFTSNIFAIMGLRSLYFVVVGAMLRLHYLKSGLACVLFFVGVKMLIAEYYRIPIGISLGVVALILTVSLGLSLLKKPDSTAAV